MILLTWIRREPLLLLVWAAVLAVHATATTSYFALDDVVWLLGVSGIETLPSTLRPVSAAVVRLEYLLFGLHPAGFLVLNLMMHLVNSALVYALGRRFIERDAAAAAAVLFGTSGIAFTPLHWAVGICDLLACALLLVATLIHGVGVERARPSWTWAAAGVGALAVLAKETAIAWPLFVLVGRWPRKPSMPVRKPALLLLVLSASWLAATLLPERPSSDLYFPDLSLRSIVSSGVTYLAWLLPADAIRDRWAVADLRLWPLAMLGLASLIVVLRLSMQRAAAFFGLAWWLAFLLPLLPISRHAYLYYLYVPSVGVCLAIGSLWPASSRTRLAQIFSVAVLLVVALEWSNVRQREQATLDALPIDFTLRQSMLLENSMADLHQARLTPGSRVGFVNPVPRTHFDRMRGAPGADTSGRVSSYPLESVMLGGRTLKLLAPGLSYAGFSEKIPENWGDVEVFLFEQRGHLRHWGRGESALVVESGYVDSMLSR